jgi:tRNA (adenine22-N1)-methyltransferase
VTSPELPPITRKLGVTPRLRALADYVPESTRVFVDIGTNHAILPIAVLRAGRATHCIGVDSSAPALQDAKRRLRRSHCLDRIELRLGDGLSVLTADEIEVICIAGMGPQRMAKILSAGLPLLNQRSVRLVLNPLGGSEEPRAFLDAHGFRVVADVSVAERGRSYAVFVAER